eukprot:6262665-Amphidinium_carterae.1
MANNAVNYQPKGPGASGQILHMRLGSAFPFAVASTGVLLHPVHAAHEYAPALDSVECRLQVKHPLVDTIPV